MLLLLGGGVCASVRTLLAEEIGVVLPDLGRFWERLDVLPVIVRVDLSQRASATCAPLRLCRSSRTQIERGGSLVKST